MTTMDGEDGIALAELDRSDLEFLTDRRWTGSFGTVFRCRWISRQKIVAAKRVLVLEKEAQILNRIRHKNIVEFYGVCHSAPDFYIITEFAEKGSLRDYLADESNDDLNFEHILRWARDIAQGVHYLHKEAPVQILHRDLKSHNVVISSDNVCKLCDFGTSKPIGQTNTSIAGTTPWMSPEMIRSEHITEATDVWSYGVVLWELLTREVPFRGLNFFQVSFMVADKGVRLTIPSSSPAQFQSLIQDCWQTNPDDRPSFTAILIRLVSMLSDGSFAKEMEYFFRKKTEWQAEIESQLANLTEREEELVEKEARMTERERHLVARPRLRRFPSYDVNAWDEDAVCNWLITNLDFPEYELTHLSQLFREHHINGERLLLLTSTDLDRIGLTSIGLQRQLLTQITELDLKNRMLINFPPLSHSLSQTLIGDKAGVNGDLRTKVVTLTLLFGHYIRQVPKKSSGPYYRWKFFMDMDLDNLEDVKLVENPCRLIKNVTFCLPTPFPQEPYKVESADGPFVLPVWMERLEGSVDVQCIVNYAENCVQKPRNTRVSLVVAYHSRQRLLEKQVDLTVRIRATNIGNESERSSGLPSAWQDRVFQDAINIPITPSPSQLISRPSWANMVARIGGEEPSKFRSVSMRSAPTPTVTPEVDPFHPYNRAVSDNSPFTKVLDKLTTISLTPSHHRRSKPSPKLTVEPDTAFYQRLRADDSNGSSWRKKPSRYIRSKSDQQLVPKKSPPIFQLVSDDEEELDELDELDEAGNAKIRIPSGKETSAVYSATIHGGDRRWVWKAEDSQENGNI